MQKFSCKRYISKTRKETTGSSVSGPIHKKPSRHRPVSGGTIARGSDDPELPLPRSGVRQELRRLQYVCTAVQSQMKTPGLIKACYACLDLVCVIAQCVYQLADAPGLGKSNQQGALCGDTPPQSDARRRLDGARDIGPCRWGHTGLL